MNTALKHYEQIALSNKQILKLLDGKANIILYPEIINFNSLDEILEPYGSCIILFESKPNFGHWCALNKINSNLVEFFNPYGGYPDDSLSMISMEFRIKSNQLHPYLSILMMDSPYELSYNEHKFQKKGNSINTCGRHCVVRTLFKNLNLKQYTELINLLCYEFDLNPDGLVTLLTAYIN
jgi:hypothetical protein